MRFVPIDLDPSFTWIELAVLSDVHYEDTGSNHKGLYERRNWVLAEPNRFLVLGGDLFNVATRDSVSDIFGLTKYLDEAITDTTDFLLPIKDRIWGAVDGNHEGRIYKSAGLRITRLLAESLGIPYDQAGMFFKVRFGSKPRNGKPQVYNVYLTHGWGGGRKPGGKLNKLEDLSGVILADLYLMGHTHFKAAFKDTFLVPDNRNNRLTEVERTFVNTSSLLNWGGYSERYGYRPTAQGSPHVRFEGGDHKKVSVTL